MRLADSARRAGYRINVYDALDSTSDEALRRAGRGERGFLWIVAGQQTGGRGRQGRRWASPPGNVYASLLLLDACPPAEAPQLAFVAGLAALRAVARFVDAAATLSLKWPNDLLAGGCKLAGVLVEGARLPSGSMASVIGIGINRTSHPQGTPYPVTDIASLVADPPSREALLAALSDEMVAALGTWARGQGFPLIREQWLAHALRPGTLLTAGPAGARVSGGFVTVDPRGRLVLAAPQGEVVIEAGDVVLQESMEGPAPGSGAMKVV